MTLISKYKHALMATALVILPAAAFAQNEAVTDQANEVSEQANQLAAETNQLTAVVSDDAAAGDDRDRTSDHDGDDDDDDSGKWGLLGLLGLAGLLGLKRRDDDVTVRRTNTDRDNRL